MDIEKDTDGGCKLMRRREAISIVEYFYCMQQRLENTVNNCSYRCIRRDLDRVELLEEIIAKEHLKLFNIVMQDVLNILKLTEHQGD